MEANETENQVIDQEEDTGRLQRAAARLMANPPEVGEIYERLADIMAAVPAIPKAQQNKAQGYAFRGIDDVYQALHRLFAEHRVVVLPEVLESEYIQQPHGRNQTLATDARILIRYTFITTDGSSVSMTLQGESRDYADKATNQAMSTAIKYGLLQMFLIPLEETRESDHESPTVDTVSAEKEKQRLISEENEVKMTLVSILGSRAAAHDFWDATKTMPMIQQRDWVRLLQEAAKHRTAMEEEGAAADATEEEESAAEPIRSDPAAEGSPRRTAEGDPDTSVPVEEDTTRPFVSEES